MHRLFLLATFGLALGGCSLISDFGDLSFADGGADSDDGGGGDTGDGGNPVGGTGGDGGGGTGGTDGGGTGGTGGDATVTFHCTMEDDGGGCTDCQTDDDCGLLVCVDNLCVACGADADCGLGSVCEANACVDCRGDSDCGDYEICVLNACVPDRKPSSVWFSSGGGDITSTNFKLRMSIGGPQPIGSATSAGLKITIGPGSGFPQ